MPSLEPIKVELTELKIKEHMDVLKTLNLKW